MTPFLLLALGLALRAPAQVTMSRQDGPVVLKSEVPAFQLTLPPSYDLSLPAEKPPRYIRGAGRESWARINALVTPTPQPLAQNPTGVTAEEILSLVSTPPNSTWTFSRTKWQDLEVGVIEYRAVVNDLPVIGLSTILPLAKKGLRITVYAPDPLEKEAREDFQQILSAISKAETNWFTTEALRKIAALEKVTIAGAVLAVLYPIVWAIFFRGHPLAAHWLRTGWLFAIAVLLFIPITSPAPTSIESNLVVNALIPLLYVTGTIRRLKLGIDAD